MNWKIAVDSSSDLHEGMECAPNVSLSIVPLVLQVDGMSFVDEPDMDMDVFMESLRASTQATGSSCPSPAAWAKVFEEADCTLALTISSELSGSYNAAMIARDLVMDEHPDKKIAVIDSRAASGQMILLAQKVNELIAKGLGFEEIIHAVEDYNQTLHIYFTLCSFDNLTKNGRMPKLVGVLAKKLGMRIIGTADQGKIAVIHKCRGDRSTLLTLIKDMKESCDLSKRHVVITHCSNLKLALTLQNLLEKESPGVRVTILPTHGLTSYYAEEHGLIVSY
ncbi:MAG: DegV family protein [Butyricicoccus pullicaecorum]|nr:DegV family protein [Butyricicoccus pullicaecorum]